MAETHNTTPKNVGEIWKPVPGFEGVYSVSSYGRIRRDLSRGKAVTGFILKPTPNRRGYLRVTLSDTPRREAFLVHRLVMQAFVGDCPAGKEVNHIDTDKTNCRLDNLEYLTGVENIEHAVARGVFANRRINYSRGEQHSATLIEAIQRGDNHYTRRCPEKVRCGSENPAARLTPDVVKEIRAAKGKERQEETAKRFGIARQTVGKIQRRLLWKHVK